MTVADKSAPYFAATGNVFQLLRGQFIPGFFRQGEELFRGLYGFNLSS